MDLLIYAQFKESKLGKTGLTVTADIYRITRSNFTVSQIVTAGSATEIGKGVYGYQLTSADLNLYDYVGAMTTATTSVDDRQPPVLWTRWNEAEALDSSGRVLLQPTQTGVTIPTVTTLTGHTPQTGDTYARLGAPAGASVSADVAAIKADAVSLLARIGAFTGTGLNTVLGFLRALGAKAAALTPSDLSSGTTYNNTTDSLEAQRDNYTAPLDDAGVRAAVGLASANLDTQLGNLPTDADVLNACDGALTGYAGNTGVAGREDLEFWSGLITTAVGTPLQAGDYTAAPDTTAIQAATAAALGAYAPPTRTEATADKAEILTRLGTPAGASVSVDLASVKTDSGNLLTNLAALAAKFTGITLLANWLRAGFRSDTPDATALSEINTGGGGFAATDSQQAIRDRGDSAWLTGGGAVEGDWTVTVTVTDSSTGDPLPGAHVTIRTTGGTRHADGNADADGVFAKPADDGSYKVSVAALPGYSGVADQAFTVAGENKAVSVELDPIAPIVVAAGTRPVRIFAYNGQGQAVEGVACSARLAYSQGVSTIPHAFLMTLNLSDETNASGYVDLVVLDEDQFTSADPRWVFKVDGRDLPAVAIPAGDGVLVLEDHLRSLA